KEIDGILVQLPLPPQIDEDKVIRSISPLKDVDGFSPINFGFLAQGSECYVPCTPLGILEILKYYQVETVGKKVCVIGRSNIVGKPVAMLLMQKGYDATVTVCNTKTQDLKKITLDSDIIIVATGHINTIDESFVKDGATVIDVGINRVVDPTKAKGFHLEGDCNFKSFENRDVAITPVPGGVGLMTVAMLMFNTLKAAERRSETV
ncbi:MAG: bifunctional 5,10-methylenetetrahydrofolate dehydrogenase/5,10-methenyltetrahydrofolate cyclohydrolase, partial [Spirochaetales bacterium]|nr:bifunctional 5,10-methylenetetrahydrofolate dehydrogenase/5,10-methenyltetrahydrofolate cyclohydrolase [Candidatus Physcosoma equi]